METYMNVSDFLSMKKNLGQWALDATELSGGAGIYMGGPGRWGVGYGQAGEGENLHKGMNLLYKIIYKCMIYVDIRLYASQKMPPENFSDSTLLSDHGSSTSMPQCSGFDLHFWH